MNINWTVRFRNPLFLAQVAASVAMPLIVGMGYEWGDMTSWATLGGTISAALGNPVIVVSMLVSLWGAVNDPTTAGLGDSEQAMTYDTPKEG